MAVDLNYKNQNIKQQELSNPNKNNDRITKNMQDVWLNIGERWR